MHVIYGLFRNYYQLRAAKTTMDGADGANFILFDFYFHSTFRSRIPTLDSRLYGTYEAAELDG